MSAQIISCPKCGEKIHLDKALTEQIRTHLEANFQNELEEKEREMKMRAEKMQKEAEQKLQHEKIQMWKEAKKIALEHNKTEMEDLQKENEERKNALEKMRREELALRQQKRKLEEKERAFALEMERKLDAERKTIREMASKKAEEGMEKRMAEKETQMQQMRKTIDDLKRKSEQSSMQVQGDAQEITLKEMLAHAFPLDTISDVPTGVFGADLIHTVCTTMGRDAGVIVWESKNTKAWNKNWISKLKDDRARAKGDICILVSQVLPEEIKNFGMVDGVWVCSLTAVLPLASTLRFHLSELRKAQQSLIGKREKMEYLYQYLGSSEFRGRIETIVSAFENMKIDLTKERTVMERIWKKREKEIDRVILNTSGFYGDLQGIMGSSLSPVASLEFPDEEEKNTLL